MTETLSICQPITSPSAMYDQLRDVSREVPCPYLPGRLSRSEAYQVDQLDGALYERLLARGFRRSGRVVYRPRCRGCQECRQLRVRVQDFAPTRSMRRVARRNADVRITAGSPEATEEKFALFHAYLSDRHDESMERTFKAFTGFLYDSPTDTLEFSYWLGERLIGVSIVDRCPGGLSSVYMYFDPCHGRRSLGTFSVLKEIDYCREQGLAYYYLGFYVSGSKTMSYKARFRHNQILVASDRWLSLP